MCLNVEQTYLGDYICTDDNYQASTEDGVWNGDGIMGRGNTQQAAIDDYWSQQDEQA